MRYSAVALAAVLAETAVASHGNEWACYAGPWKPEGEETTPATTIPFPNPHHNKHHPHGHAPSGHEKWSVYPGWGSSGIAAPTGSVIVSTTTESETGTTATTTSSPAGKIPVGPSGSIKPSWSIVPGWGWKNSSDPAVTGVSGAVAGPTGTDIVAPIVTGISDPSVSIDPVATSVVDPTTSSVVASTGAYYPYSNSSGHGYAWPSGTGYAHPSGAWAKPTGWVSTPGWTNATWSNSTSNTHVVNSTMPMNTTASADPAVADNSTAPFTAPAAPFANGTSNSTGGFAQPTGKPFAYGSGSSWNTTNTTEGYVAATGTGYAKPTGWVVTPGWTWSNATNHTSTSFNGTFSTNHTTISFNTTVPSNVTDPAMNETMPTNTSIPLSTGTASPAPFLNSTVCYQNNCYRDVLAGAFPERPTAADCSAFLIATVTAAPATTTETETLTATEISTIISDVTTTSDILETITITETITLATTETDTATTTSTMPFGAGIFKRQAAPTIPAYATANCGGAVAYASACSCALGITPGTTTVPAPMVTETATLTTTTTITTVEENTITVEATLSFTEIAVATTFTPTTVTVTSTVFVSAPTCATFYLMAVNGPNEGSYVQIVSAEDELDDYAAVFNADILEASVLSWESDTGYVSDVATGRYANSDGTAGLNLASVYFNTVDQIASAPSILTYVTCTSDGTSFACQAPSGDNFYTDINDAGVLIGGPTQTDPLVQNLELAVINYSAGACAAPPATTPELTLNPKN